MEQPRIYIFHKDQNGNYVRGEADHDISEFGGVLPQVGDQILDPLIAMVGSTKNPDDFHDPAKRTILTVKERIFRPEDGAPSVILVVESQTASRAHIDIF